MLGAPGKRQDDVGAGAELVVDVVLLPSLRHPRRPGRWRCGLATIENDPDVRVVLEAIDEIVVERGVAAGDDEEVTGLAHIA